MLIYSMSVSVDGFIDDRAGSIDFTAPSDEQFGFSLEQVGELGGYLLGHRLYETMLVWEVDPSLRTTADGAAFADVWSAIPKVVFSRTLGRVEGGARIAAASLREEIAMALEATDKDVSIGGATLAAGAIELDLIDEYRMFRAPHATGGGTSYWPPLVHPLPLELVETRSFGAGVIYERYRRRRGDNAEAD
jgi:dihydrofolate reductase